MKMMNKVCALVLSVALCAGMAAPAFAYGGEPVEEVEQPVLTATPDESDAVTVTDEESGALTPEGNLTLVDDYHTNYRSSGRVGPAQCLRCQIRQVEHCRFAHPAGKVAVSGVCVYPKTVWHPAKAHAPPGCGQHREQLRCRVVRLGDLGERKKRPHLVENQISKSLKELFK